MQAFARLGRSSFNDGRVRIAKPASLRVSVHTPFARLNTAHAFGQVT